jgi:hypothetical protein
MADGLLEVREFDCSRFQNARAEIVVMTFSDTIYVHSGNGKLHFALDYERYSRPSVPPRSIRHYVKRFYPRINIFKIQLLIQNEKCALQSWI